MVLRLPLPLQARSLVVLSAYFKGEISVGRMYITSTFSSVLSPISDTLTEDGYGSYALGELERPKTAYRPSTFPLHPRAEALDGELMLIAGLDSTAL